jgi:putative glutamine amidotransferase
MNLVAVTQRVEVIGDRDERRDALDQRWGLFLQACGLMPLLVPNQPEIAEELLAAVSLQGLLLTGGNSLSAYGGDAPERDATETRLLAMARQRRWPVVGVCRGMQVIQHHYGVPLKKIRGHANVVHPLVVDGSAAPPVNSFHDFGATDSVPPLDVIATAGDGMVEAVRHVTDRVLGVMWHPERYAPFRQPDIKMFRDWFGLA